MTQKFYLKHFCLFAFMAEIFCLFFPLTNNGILSIKSHMFGFHLLEEKFYEVFSNKRILSFENKMNSQN